MPQTARTHTIQEDSANYKLLKAYILLFCRPVISDNMKWEVRIGYKPGVQDTEGGSTLEGLKTLGFEKVKTVHASKVYLIEGDYSRADVEEMCRRLPANPVSQNYTIEEVKESR